jgi:hypothetical protein
MASDASMTAESATGAKPVSVCSKNRVLKVSGGATT